MTVKTHYPVSELAGLPGMPDSKSAVRRMAIRNAWIFREGVTKDGKNRKCREYPLTALPPQTRQALLPAIPAPPAPVPITKPAPLLTETQKNHAAAKHALLRLYIDHLAAAPPKQKTPARDAFILLYQAGQWPELRARLGKVSWKTIEDWKRKLTHNNGDPHALADTRGRVRRGATSLPPEQRDILSIFAHHPNNLRISHCVRWAMLVMRHRGMDTLSARSYNRAILSMRAANYPLWVFSREGEQALESECGYTLKRDYAALQVGDQLTADGHVLNFSVLNPWTGKPCRPTLILWYDTRSNMPLGWEIMPTENTAAIHAALRRAILALGKMPRVAYLDNGRAFKGRHFTDTTDFDNGAITGLYARLGIATTFATAYHGQSKTVERFFGNLLELESILPSYTGNSIDNKPARLHRGERLHRRLWEKYGNAEQAVTIAQAHEILAAWFDDYASRPQRGHLDGQSPMELFQAGRGPGVDEQALVDLMLSVKISTVSKQGVKLFGEFYYHPAIYGRITPVLARFDLADRSFLLLCEPDTGEFICRATPQAQVHPAAKHLGTDEDREILAAELATKNRLKSLTVGPARELLRSHILPEHQLQLAQIGLLPEQTGEGPQPAKGHRAPSAFPPQTPLTAEEYEASEKMLAATEKRRQQREEDDNARLVKISEQLEKASGIRQAMPASDIDAYEMLKAEQAGGLELSDREHRWMLEYERYLDSGRREGVFASGWKPYAERARMARASLKREFSSQNSD